MKSKWRKVAAYSALAVAGLLGACVLVLTLMDWNRLKGPLERIASAHLGRTVTVTGPLQVRIWSRTPTLSITGLEIGNPSWETKPDFLQIENLQIQLDLHSLFRGHIVLRQVALRRPELYLHRDKSDRANWTFETTAPSDDRASAPLKLPAIQNAVIDSGKLIVIDEIDRLNVAGTIEAQEGTSASDERPLHIEGRGTLNSEPFHVVLSGGALLAINPEHPYPFTVDMQAGHHEINVQGNVRKPFDLSGLEFSVSAHGPDLADLYYLSRIALPNTPPYQMQAHVVRTGQRFEVRDIKGVLGTTDIGGTVDIDASHKRPFLMAKLVSQHLFLKDLGAVTGSRVNAEPSLSAKGGAGKGSAGSNTRSADAARLFPDAHLQVSRVQGMDANLSFKANSITAGQVPFTRASFEATLKDGVLTVHPARFDMPQGRLSGLVSIDTRLRPPKVHVDMRAADVELEQVKGKAPGATAPLGGLFEARAIIDGRGDSVRTVMADANGTVTGVIPHGDIRASFAELTGVDVAAGIGLLLKKPDDRAAIRCGLARFDVRDGTARADNIVMDTQNVLIMGSGKIEFGSEDLDLAIQGHPKKFHLLRLKTPVKIGGHMLKPTIGLDTGHLARQGAVAAALGTVLAPIAAVLAFVDPGLAKDQNCAALLQPHEQDTISSGASRSPPARNAPERVADKRDSP
jgi:uncharacterized protein involved in outer membrane biogenesis